MNVALIRKIADRLSRIRHEEHYNQNVWLKKSSCGTEACIAGYAALLTGWKPDPNQYENVIKGGRTLLVRHVGEKALRLTSNEMKVLFSGGGNWPGDWAQRFIFARNGTKRPGAKAVERPSRVAAAFLRAIADKKVILDPLVPIEKLRATRVP